MHIAYLVDLLYENVNGAGLPNILILFVWRTKEELNCSYTVLKLSSAILF